MPAAAFFVFFATAAWANYITTDFIAYRGRGFKQISINIKPFIVFFFKPADFMEGPDFLPANDLCFKFDHSMIIASTPCFRANNM